MSPAETKELEDLKQSIIERKAILKEQGFSGGQQNKDEEIATGYWFHLLFGGRIILMDFSDSVCLAICVECENKVKMVARMNELKEKQEPGSSKKEKDAKKETKKKTPLSPEEQRDFINLQGEVEVYKAKLRNEFGYSNKEMKADPDLQDMELRLAAFQRRA